MKEMDDSTSNGRLVNITGVGNHLINQKRIGKFCSVSPGITKGGIIGDILCIWFEYALVIEQATSIHSMVQLEAFGAKISDKAIHLGGKQLIVTACGTTFPIMIKKGLPYLPQHKPTDAEMNGGLPQVIMTSDQEWDPSIYDTTCTIDELLQSFPIPKSNDIYDDKGNIVVNISTTDNLIDNTDEEFDMLTDKISSTIVAQNAISTPTLQINSTHVGETKSSSIPKSSNAISALDFDTRTQRRTSKHYSLRNR